MAKTKTTPVIPQRLAQSKHTASRKTCAGDGERKSIRIALQYVFCRLRTSPFFFVLSLLLRLIILFKHQTKACCCCCQSACKDRLGTAFEEAEDIHASIESKNSSACESKLLLISEEQHHDEICRRLPQFGQGTTSETHNSRALTKGSRD